MIDVKKALSQRCYIIFDTNEQLVKFVKEQKLSVYMMIYNDETALLVDPQYDEVYLKMNDDCYITGTLKEIEEVNVNGEYTGYHHSQLTITDDGE